MTKTTSNERKPPRPTFIVETSLAESVTPKLDAWLDDLDAAIPRVVNDSDGEAVHDLRVAMRRIRSLLKMVRPGLWEGLRQGHSRRVQEGGGRNRLAS